MRAFLLIAFTVSAFGQTFEAASINPSPPLDGRNGPIYVGSKGGPGSPDPIRYSCTWCDIPGLVSEAYNMPFYRVISSGRVSQDRFHITATLPAGATRDQFRAMLQSLLTDRFQLKTHTEQRDTQMFRLVTASGGAKLKPHVDGAPPAPKPPNSNRAPGFYYYVQGKTLADFAKVLEGQLRKPVADATGLSGAYDFEVWWSMDTLQAESSPAENPNVVRSSSDSPTILSAIQSLGLRLESAKGKVDVIVIDEVSKMPTGN